MNFFETYMNDLDKATAEYEIMNDKIMLFESTAYSDLIIKQKQSQLEYTAYGYVTESDDDKAKFSDKVKAAITKIVENVKEFLEKCRDKIVELFEKMRESNLIKKVNELLKRDPSAGKIKVEVEDNTEKRRFLRKSKSDAEKDLARIKSGKIKEDDLDNIEDRKNKTAIKLAATAAVVTMTVAGILLAINQFKNDSEDTTSKKAMKCLPAPSSLPNLPSPQDEHVMISATGEVADYITADARLSLQDGSNYVRALKTGLAGYLPTGDQNTKVNAGKAFNSKRDDRMDDLLRQEMNRRKPVNTGKALKGGYKEISATAGPIQMGPGNPLPATNTIHALSESYDSENFDPDDYFTELCNDVFGTDEPDYDSSDDYFTELCNDVFGTDDGNDFDKMYSELCDDIFF